MIDINFCDDIFCEDSIYGLTQWDVGQYLRIGGLNTTNRVRVQFSLQNYEGSAVEVETTIEGDFVVAKVPQFILENPDVTGAFYNAYVFICKSESANCCKTTRKVKLVIRTRPKPEDYVFTDDEIKTFDQLAEDLRNHIDEDIEAALKDIEIEGVVVDDELSEESDNPVQNKVITAEVKALREENEALEQKNTELEEKNAELESSIEELQIKTTTDKSPFHHITDSANMKVLDFGMEGITEQETTSGKQLLDNSGIESATVEGVTFTVKEDGSIIANGTTGEKIALFYVGTVTLDSSKEYILSGCGGTGSTSTYSLRINNNVTSWDDIGKGVTFPGGVSGSYRPFIFVRANQTVSNVVFKPMVRLSSVTDATYEPFTNGATPNPTHPEDIKLAGVYNEETGRYEHKCCVGNKNLFDLAKAQDESNYVEGSKWLYFPIYVGKSNTVTFSCILPTQTNYSVIITDGIDGGTISYIWHYSNTALQYDKVTFVSPNDYIYIRAIAKGYDPTVWATDFTNIQVEVSPSQTDYTPHASQPFTLTSDRPLTMWDNLVKVDGKWYWDYKQQHWSINDTVDWYAYDSYKGFFAQCCFPVLLTNSEGYCNQLRNDTVGISPSKVSNHFWIGNNRDHFYVLGSSYYDESLEDKGLANWKAHLKEHPLEIVTYKDESELVPLPDEEQELLRNLEMYYGVTNVYNEQGCPMWLEYVNDTKLYVDNQIKNAVATTQALILEN